MIFLMLFRLLFFRTNWRGCLGLCCLFLRIFIVIGRAPLLLLPLNGPRVLFCCSCVFIRGVGELLEHRFFSLCRMLLTHLLIFRFLKNRKNTHRISASENILLLIRLPICSTPSHEHREYSNRDDLSWGARYQVDFLVGWWL